jgi:hypothetical protein
LAAIGARIALSWLVTKDTFSMRRYRLGRSLQFLGLLILPFAMASELLEKVGLGQSVLIAAFGALVFYIGFQIQYRP